MNVLIVPSWYSSEREPVLGSFFKEQALALKKAGLNPIIAYPEICRIKYYGTYGKNMGFHKYIEDGLCVYRYKGYKFLPLTSRHGTLYVKNLLKLYKMIKKDGIKIHIIHAHSCLWGGYGAALISKKENIPLIITEHSTAFSRNLITQREEIQVKEALAEANKIIVVGSGLKKELSRYTDKEVSIIPNMVNTNHFKMEAKHDRVKKDKFTFFSLGFLMYKKGMDILIKAFTEAFKGKEDIELLIGGDGEERKNLESLVKDLDMEKQIKFLGELSRDKAVEYMNYCDAFALASRYETFGVVFIEALACGKPIIASACDGPEFIVIEDNGILVKPEDIDDLKKALIKIKENYRNYNKNIIRADCERRFSEKAVIGKIIDTYNSILKEN